MRKNIFSVLLIIITLNFVVISCKKDDNNNNNNNNNTTPKGNLQVFVHKDLATGVCMGNVEVKLYVSDSARMVDDDTLTALTDDLNPTITGAMFFNLPFRSKGYYLKASFDYQGNPYVGTGNLVVPTNTTTSYHITATKQ